MGASSEKKKFLQARRNTLRWGGAFRVPAEIMHRINKSHQRDRALHACADLRDYITQIALQGLHAVRGGSDLADIAVRYGTLPAVTVNIDYAIIDHGRLDEFDVFAGNRYIRTVHHSISYCIVLGYIDKLAQATCPGTKLRPSIYS